MGTGAGTSPHRIPPIKRVKEFLVPFIVKPYRYDPAPEASGAGRHRGPRAHPVHPRVPIEVPSIPPRFVHTWAVDVKGVTAAHLDLLGSLYFEDGDRVTVINSDNRVLKTYHDASSFGGDFFPLAATMYDNAPYQRIYIILETGPSAFDRAISIKGLRAPYPRIAGQEAVRIEDDVNYKTAEPFVDARDRDGEPFDLTPPSGADNDWPPSRADGWYLFAKNVTNPDPSFWSLIYYNEYTSRLRVYLYNLDLTPTATNCLVEVSLRGGPEGSQALLKGQFFPVSVNPADWSTAVALVPSWPRFSWTKIELPMLYPAKLYESLESGGGRNVRLRLTLTPNMQGILKGTALGEAIGQGVQTFQGPDLKYVASGIIDAFKQGGDWYKASSGFADAVLDYTKEHGPISGGMGEAVALVGGGAFAMSPYLAAAGAALSLYKTFFDDPDPLVLAIDLALRAELSGAIITEETPNWCEFYLPGRFSIREAFDCDAPLRKSKKWQYTDSAIPRYDRAVGLFGYATDPSLISPLPVERQDEIPDSVNYIPPGGGQHTAKFLIPRGMTHIPEFLGVVYNPFAGLSIISSKAYCKCLFESAGFYFYRNSVEPERSYKDVAVADYGYELDVVGGMPQLYRDFERPENSPSIPHYLTYANAFATVPTKIKTAPYYGVEVTCLTPRKGGDGEFSTETRKFDAQNLLPLHDAVEYWEITYACADRHGNDAGERHAILSSPIRVDLTVSLWNCGEQKDSWSCGTVASVMLRSPKQG